ncbi:VOC family protein [Granulicella sp. 5B5]|uniref:VOC family protein n=1 Tax=Granulicella sp. 5B5 TaxID=1617967 RepID=UPI0015F3FE7C|nr:VOC family protein [Granulicella sp. 5B5]QMV18198.1 VOC family protein [Granulicella sp. 5B5]
MAETTIVPWVSVKKGRGVEAVAFYERAFGAQRLLLIDNEKGVVARMAVGGAEFWLADEDVEHRNVSPESVHAVTTRLILMVSDPDALWERAVAEGAVPICPMKDDHGWRVGGVRDPFGHHWEMAREDKGGS